MSRDNIKTPECVSFVNQILNLYYANGELNLPPYLRGKGIENINFEALKKLKGGTGLKVLTTYINETSHIDPKIIWAVNNKEGGMVEKEWGQPLKEFNYKVPRKKTPPVYYSPFRPLKYDWSSFKFMRELQDFIVIEDILYINNKDRKETPLKLDKIPIIDITAIKGKRAVIENFTLFKGEFEDKLEFESLVCIETCYTKVGFLRVKDGSFHVKFIDVDGKVVRGSKE